MTADGWLAAHEYLRPLSELAALVGREAEDLRVAGAPAPSFDAWREDFRAGIPLLRSESAAPDLEPAGAAAAELVSAVASRAASGPLRDATATLDAALRSTPDAARRISGWLLGDESWSPPSPGLLRYLGWAAARRWLRPVVEAFERSGEDERWGRGWCPTCGAAPSMAHLSESESSRARKLCCGMCGARWPYPRTKCPFCEADSQRLSIVSVEGEGGLRIDYCPACRGYLKTYAGSGDEAIMLSDWSSLHLDLAAQARGLQRAGASLYEIALPAPA